MPSGHGSLLPAKINGFNLGIITGIKSKIELDPVVKTLYTNFNCIWSKETEVRA